MPARRRGGGSGSSSSEGGGDGGGATTFDGLTDTPRRKVAGQYPRVNAAGSAIAYHDADGDVSAVRALADENRATLDGLGHVTETRGDFAAATADDLAALWGMYPSRDGTFTDADFSIAGTIASPGVSAVYLRAPAGVSTGGARILVDPSSGAADYGEPNYADPLDTAAWHAYAAPDDARAHAAYYRLQTGEDAQMLVSGDGANWTLQLAPLTRSVDAAGRAVDVYGWRDGAARSTLPADAADRVTRIAYVGRGLVPMSFASALGRYLHFILPLAYELDLISIAGDNRVGSFATATDVTRRLYHSGQLAADAGDIDVLLRVVEAA